MKIVLVTALMLFISNIFSQDITAYQLYDKNGKKVSYKKMVKKLEKDNVVLFGELHNNPIAHWMQLKLTQELQKKEKSLALGAEMFEADNQKELNAYLNGEINQKGFDTLARLWSNYATDYKPLVDFSKDNKIPFIATNVPRRYASMVYKNGFEVLMELDAEEKLWVAPYPFPYDPELPGYKNMQTMMSDHANENFPKAQAIKDATMGYFIMKFLLENPDHLFLHYHGTYHSNNYEGIYWYLEHYAKELSFSKDLSIGTISTVLQSDVTTFNKENLGLADFILVVDEDMTTTH